MTTISFTHIKKIFPYFSVIKNFFAYSLGSLFLKAISMIIVPLIMKKLSPSDYGTLSLITSFIAIAAAIIGLGLRQVVSIEYFHCKTLEEKTKLINEIIVIYTTIAVPILLISLHFKTLIIQYIFFNAIGTLFIPMLIIVFLSFFVEFFYQLLQYEQYAYLLTFIQLFTALLSTTLTMFFLWQYNLGIASIVLAQLITIIFSTFLASIIYYKKIYTSQLLILSVFFKIKYFISYGFPFIPGILFSWVIASSDRWILGYYCTMHEVGIYSVADLFAQLFYFLVLQPWAGSYLPYIMGQYAQSDNDQSLIEQKNLQCMWIVMFTLVVFISIGCSFLPFIVNFIFPKQYIESIQYVWVLLIGQVFLLGSYFCSSLIQFHKRTYFLASALAFPATINIILNIILVPFFSIKGATIATLTSYIIYFMVTHQYNARLRNNRKRKLNESYS